MLKYYDIISKMTLEEKCYMFSGGNFWQTRSIDRLGVPSMVMSDGPNGVRKQEGAGDQLGLNPALPATCFPSAATVANSWDPALGEEIGKCLGDEAARQDVDVLLGPGLNIKRSPLCGRDFEYFSEDPYLAGKMAAAYVRGIQSEGVSACPKHFAVNSQELRRMASDSVLDERTLREIYLTAFEIVVKEADPHSIMSSYNRVNGVYANENRHLLREILVDDWGFNGYVVSDWGASNDYSAGVAAGAHMEMPGTGDDSGAQLLKSVKSGKVSEEWIDQMLDELLAVVFSTTKAVAKKRGTAIDMDAHHAMAAKAAEESIVLLKNNGILPLKNGVSAALIGDFAAKPRYQGAGSSEVNASRTDSVLSLIKEYDINICGFAKGYHRAGPPDSSLEKEAAAFAKKADVVLMFIGLDEISESEGLDRKHMKMPKSHLSLLKKVSKVNKNIVVILSAGSPVEMPWISKTSAVLHAYLGGQAGASAVLKALTGQINPSGKLAETYPMKYEDVSSAPYFPAKERTAEYREGLFVGYRYYDTAKVPVRFPFGYGLSYTTFAYSGLTIDQDGDSPEHVKCRFTVKNTGTMAGAEIAQIYVSAIESRIFRPAKELKGFAKVFLEPGESREVTIELDDKAFRYFNSKTNRFEIEGGSYEILVGASSEDIRLRQAIHVRGTGAEIPCDAEKLPHYYAGDVKNIPDSEFAELLGYPIPDGKWSGELDVNDAICQMYYAKNPIARLVFHIMNGMLKKSEKKGVPNLNLMFVFNMPFRGIAKMTGGMVTMEMAEGIVSLVNGHIIRGAGQLAGGFFRSLRKR